MGHIRMQTSPRMETAQGNAPADVVHIVECRHYLEKAHGNLRQTCVGPIQPNQLSLQLLAVPAGKAVADAL